MIGALRQVDWPRRLALTMGGGILPISKIGRAGDEWKS
jgi:hypothetical protein